MYVAYLEPCLEKVLDTLLLSLIISDVIVMFTCLNINMKCLELLKLFKSEVVNQIGKTIKALRSYRGDEYMSQEILDHLNTGCR